MIEVSQDDRRAEVLRFVPEFRCLVALSFVYPFPDLVMLPFVVHRLQESL